MWSDKCKKTQCYLNVRLHNVCFWRNIPMSLTAGIEWTALLHRPQRTMCVLWSVCAFARFHSIAKSQLNEFTIASKIHFSWFFFASLRMNCFYSFHGVTFFFCIFHQALNVWLIFNEHIKKFNVLTYSSYSRANWKFIQIFEKTVKRTNLKICLWKSQIRVYFNLFVFVFVIIENDLKSIEKAWIYTEKKLTVMIILQAHIFLRKYLSNWQLKFMSKLDHKWSQCFALSAIVSLSLSPNETAEVGDVE